MSGNDMIILRCSVLVQWDVRLYSLPPLPKLTLRPALLKAVLVLQQGQTIVEGGLLQVAISVRSQLIAVEVIGNGKGSIEAATQRGCNAVGGEWIIGAGGIAYGQPVLTGRYGKTGSGSRFSHHLLQGR